MKVAYLLIIAIAIVPLVASITYIGYQRAQIENIETVEVALEVADMYGFNVNSSRLNLGAIPPGGYAYRNFTVFNTGDKTYNIELVMSGPMKKWTSYSHERFVLGPGEEQSVLVGVRPPGDTEMKEYLSTIYVIYKRP